MEDINRNIENEGELSGKQSFDIIQKMINQAKNKVNDNGNEWIIWGTMIFLASISTFFFVQFNYSNLFLGWNVFGLLAVLILAYRLFRRKPKPVLTYLDELLILFDIGFIVCMLLIIFAMNVAVTPNAGFGFLLMIYAFLMLIQGGAMKFRPLIYGAIINWIGAILIFWNKEFKYDMLITAAAVLFGYIIPGLILRAQARRTKTTNSRRNGV